MIHGMVDNPLVFTMEELKRLPSVTRMHFIECAGNRANRRHRTVQETHGMTSCAEWTGVLLSTLLKEAGVQDGGDWIVAEGVENVVGASSIHMAKAMDDCIVCYGMNGEAVRPQQGFPLRLLVPGFEGILNVKWLRRIKVVDQFYMTYNDYGHLRQDSDDAALGMQIGPKSVITYPSGGQQLPGRGFYEVSGLAWSGGGAVADGEASDRDFIGIHRELALHRNCRVGVLPDDLGLRPIGTRDHHFLGSSLEPIQHAHRGPRVR